MFCTPIDLFNATSASSSTLNLLQTTVPSNVKLIQPNLVEVKSNIKVSRRSKVKYIKVSRRSKVKFIKVSRRSKVKYIKEDFDSDSS